MDKHSITTYDGHTFSILDVLVIEPIHKEGEEFAYKVIFKNSAELLVKYKTGEMGTYADFERSYAELLNRFEESKQF